MFNRVIIPVYLSTNLLNNFLTILSIVISVSHMRIFTSEICFVLPPEITADQSGVYRLLCHCICDWEAISRTAVRR